MTVNNISTSSGLNYEVNLSEKVLEANRIYFWQGKGKCKDGALKYQNQNINKPDHKRKLSLIVGIFHSFS